MAGILSVLRRKRFSLGIAICFGRLAFASASPLAAQESKTRSSSALIPLFADDFQQNALQDYAVAGKVSYSPGAVALEAGGSLQRKVKAGAWVSVRLDLRFPELSRDGDSSESSLRFSFAGATDCLVRWRANRKDGQSIGRLEIVDTRPQAKEPAQQRIVRRAWEPLEMPPGVWQVSYRYGLVKIDGPGKQASQPHHAFLDNDTSPVTAVDLTQDAGGPLRLHSLSVAGLQPPAKLSEQDRQELAEASKLSREADTLFKAGTTREAIAAAEKARDIRRRILGTDHLPYTQTLDQLAKFYDATGAYSQAEPFYRERSDVYKRLFGADHPYYAYSLHRLAVLYLSSGAYAKAESLLLESRGVYARALGADHLAVATNSNELGGLYEELGNYEQARRFYTEACDIFKRAQAPRLALTPSVSATWQVCTLRWGCTARPKRCISSRSPFKSGSWEASMPITRVRSTTWRCCTIAWASTRRPKRFISSASTAAVARLERRIPATPPALRTSACSIKRWAPIESPRRCISKRATSTGARWEPRIQITRCVSITWPRCMTNWASTKRPKRSTLSRATSTSEHSVSHTLATPRSSITWRCCIES